MLQKDPNVLRESTKPRELVNMACVFARSREPVDHAFLRQHLGAGEFLRRLNTKDEYLCFPARTLDVARVLRTLMDAGTSEARVTLVSLTGSTAFQSFPSLVELLIRALAGDQPASQATIAYWERHLAADSGYAHIVAEVLFINRSEPALALFERTVNDPTQEQEFIEVWLRDPLLRQRNDPAVVGMCERMVTHGTVVEHWREPVVEALFDYNEGWYMDCLPPKPPLRVLAPDETKVMLHRIGRYALDKMQLTRPGLKQKVRLAMREIGYDEDGEDSCDRPGNDST